MEELRHLTEHFLPAAQADGRGGGGLLALSVLGSISSGTKYWLSSR